MITLLFSLLNAAPQAATGAEAQGMLKMIGQFLPFILIIVIFYFFLIRPQNKQRKALMEMINNLKVGDKVITKGGIIAKIVSVSNNNLIVELNDGTKMEILKHAVVSIINENKQ
ncbi:preprotein translocase subunit YajC [Candidatus Dependentiae bacterium]|nr:preprotein translocase subunit YajC [Candidatus Dependentiae bacterium]